jgi:ectoine hydroxylase-related dioxygenase (phytanoyl-CoA dioxygenase family)
MKLSDEAVRSYVDDGYLVVPDLVAKDDLEAICTEMVHFARGDYPLVNPPEEVAGRSDDQLLAQVLAVHHPHWVSPVIRDLVSHPEIVSVLQRIAGAHLPHWDGRVKCMQSMLFGKSPGLPGQAWHQDERYIATRDRSLVGAWIAVDDATLSNGCLRVLSGSHRSGYLWPTRSHGKPEEFDFADESFGFDATDEIAVEVEAGTVVFFNGYLLHRSLKNRSSDFRRALVNHYCNAWSLLPWSTGPFQKLRATEIATHDERNIVPIGEDPYAWKGYTDPPGRVFLRPHTSSDALAKGFGSSRTTQKGTAAEDE